MVRVLRKFELESCPELKGLRPRTVFETLVKIEVRILP